MDISLIVSEIDNNFGRNMHIFPTLLFNVPNNGLMDGNL